MAGASEVGLAEPVLVDPVTARVYAIEGATREGERWALPDLPLLAHPLLVMDRAIALGKGAGD